MTLVQKIVDRGGVLEADRPAVAFKTEIVTYRALKERMVNIGSHLFALGVEPGDRVLFSAVSRPEAVAVYLGIQYAGAVAVPVDKNAAAGSAAFLYKDTGARLFLTDKPLPDHPECRVLSLRGIYAVQAEQVRPPVPRTDDDLAEIIYTSGTTGQPKGAMLTYKAVRTIWTKTIEGTGMRTDDIVLLPLPLNHSFALRVLRAALWLGAVVVLQNGFTFAREIENNLDRFACTTIAIVPASVETVTRQMQGRFAEIMGRFRYIEVSAGSLSIDQRRRLAAELPNTRIVNTWGSSESGGALFLDVKEAVKSEATVGALGKPLPGVQVRTLDEQGHPFESDAAHPGRMAIRGDMQMSGYWNRPEQTTQTLRDGWLLTGDMIYLGPGGYVYMLGRADDIINVGGEKVSPLEVENAAGEYADVAECACIGVLGFVPVLFVVPKTARFSQEEMTKFLAGRLEKYKLPACYIELAALPRSAMQKVDRRALKLLWEQRDTQTPLNETMRVLLTRRSVRRFVDKPVPRELLELILKAGYHAPSGHNLQTWQFTVVQSPAKIATLKEVARQTTQENHVYFYGFENPAALVLVSNDRRAPYGCQDAACASENIMLAAWSYGLGSVWLNPLMTLRDKEPIKTVLDGLGIPAEHTVWSMLALGWPAAEGALLQKKTDVVHWVDAQEGDPV